MVETMNETDGRVGVVVPHGVLFRGGSEGLIRQRFIEENLLDGVIGLPANLFFGVGIPAALMFFRRNKTDQNVFFIDASREYAEGKNQNKLREEDLEKIVATWRARADVPKYAHLATPEELKENEYNLNIPLYVDTFEEEAPIDLDAVKAEIARIESELATTRAKLATALNDLGVS
jgi:type I restriction enzyme M protein